MTRELASRYIRHAQGKASGTSRHNRSFGTAVGEAIGTDERLGHVVCVVLTSGRVESRWVELSTGP
jgi:hypothetical protein